MRRVALAACVLTLLSLAAWVERSEGTGLGLRIFDENGALLLARPRAALGTGRIDALSALGGKPRLAEWAGYWVVPKAGFAELVLKTDGEATVEVDGAAILGSGGETTRGPRSRQPVAPGAHRLKISYRPSVDPGQRREIFLKGVTPDGASVPIERRSTTTRDPSTVDNVMTEVERFLPLVAGVVWGIFIVASWRLEPARFARLAPAAALVLMTLAAGAFRFESLAIRYWGVAGPDWAEALAADIRGLRPGAFEHAPYAEAYGGDPFSYLTIARSMGGFYEPSSREPLFPALTRLALWLAADRDIGINFLSALASTLTCVSIFALGARLLSPWSGLLAALLWAIEWQTIAFSVEGWRDDLFTLQVAACAAGLVSLHLRPTTRGALLLGLVGGLTLLTRLSALTFLIPGIVAAVLLPSNAGRPDRLRASAIALGGMGLLAGPFMISCALGYGDPFHAVNVHAAFYRSRAGLEGSGGLTAVQFLAQSRLPWEFVETGYVGLTSFPFLNKWSGFGAWLPGLGDTVRLLALAGLPVLLLRPAGLVALVVLFSSIAPYAWTWDIPGGSEWRFTLPAYPFYLVSAAIAVESAIRFIAEVRARAARRNALHRAVRYGVVAGVLLLGVPWIHQKVDWLRIAEGIRSGRSTLIQAGAEARDIFASGWRLRSEGGGAFEMTGTEARLWIPLPEGRRARVVLRLGATTTPRTSVEVQSGTRTLVTLEGDAEGTETAVLDLAQELPRSGGVVELRFVRQGPSAAVGAPLTLLWVRVEL